MENKSGLLWKIVEGMIFCTVLSMLIVVVIQVIGRVLSNSLPWTEELTRYCFLWTVNFGMTIGILNAAHSYVTIVYDLFKTKKQLVGQIRKWIYFIACVIFFGFACYWNLGMTLRQISNGEMSPALGIPMFIVTIPLFICDILALLASVQSVFFLKSTADVIGLKPISNTENLERIMEESL
ncbi:MAG: TRAP transporter small permease [Sphaerochaetaceae bacterium]